MLGTESENNVEDRLAKLGSSVETIVKRRSVGFCCGVVDYSEFGSRLILSEHFMMRQIMDLFVYNW